MSGKKIKMVDGIGQKSMQEAVEDFMRHCKLKNLSAATQEYYREDAGYVVSRNCSDATFQNISQQGGSGL